MIQRIISFIIAGGVIVAIVLSLREDKPVVQPVAQVPDQQEVAVTSESKPNTPTPVPIKPVVKATVVTTNTTTSSPKSYTFTEVAKHNNESSCWTVVNGNVYNVTSWISEHPGGAEAILQLCGRDGSEAFTDQHGGDRRPEAELALFKIGVLK